MRVEHHSGDLGEFGLDQWPQPGPDGLLPGPKLALALADMYYDGVECGGWGSAEYEGETRLLVALVLAMREDLMLAARDIEIANRAAEVEKNNRELAEMGYEEEHDLRRQRESRMWEAISLGADLHDALAKAGRGKKARDAWDAANLLDPR